jgi:hypothetical protein
MVTDSGLRRVLLTPNPSKIYEKTAYHLRRYLARRDIKAELAAIARRERLDLPPPPMRRVRTAPSAA